MKSLHLFRPVSALALLATALPAQAQSFAPIPAFPLAQSDLSIVRPTQPVHPFTVAGQRGVLVGTQDGAFESWILPVKLLSHLTMEAQVEGYSVPIEVNPQSASIEVRPDRTTITYAHIAFTIRQIMYSPDIPEMAPGTGPVVLFQIDSLHPMDITFRFTPEMRWMWPKRNDGIPGAEWVASKTPVDGGYYVLHMDYPDLAGAVTIPGAQPGILAPYQERPQVHPLELKLHIDPKRDNGKYFPLLMAVGASPETAATPALGQALQKLNDTLAASYTAHAAAYQKLLSESTSIETPDKALNDAFRWGIVSIEQLKAHAWPTQETALVAGYYSSGDSARPGFGWFFGRDALYTLYAVNGFGDFALTRAELEFLIARQRPDGKIMHEFSQTAADPVVNWKSFPYMYAAADSTPLFLMALRDYYRSSGDLAFIQAHRETIEKAWAFETAASSDTDHDGIYDNSQGTGWVESWPTSTASGGMPHQEIYLAALDEQASSAYAALESALGDSAKAEAAQARAARVKATLESEYYDPAKGCYAFSHNADGSQDRTSTIYPAVAYWDSGSSLDHPAACLQQFAAPTLATDWGLRDVATTEPIYDGMSYHQGSVWPLFTGWAALAEYRGGQPLAGEQMLMQNVDLTWAQDPGAVTELLSGDYFVPFGRSTSHQLWSSAMVITPSLRGIFGISLDAATNTITVNPHLPAEWSYGSVHNLILGSESLALSFDKADGALKVRAISLTHWPNNDPSFENPSTKVIHLRSDDPGTKLITSGNDKGALVIPLPPVEIVTPSHVLPGPGAETAQFRVLSAEYGPNSLTLEVAGQPERKVNLYLVENESLPKLDLDKTISGNPQWVGLTKQTHLKPGELPQNPSIVSIHFPPGKGWQTTKITLTW